MRIENLKRILAKNFNDVEMDDIENNFPNSAAEKKYRFLLKWKNKTGARLRDLKNMMIEAAEDEISVENKVFKLLLERPRS